MLNVSVVGIGNAGSQVAALAQQELSVDVLAINSSENDFYTLPESVPRVPIGDLRGAGKDRKTAKVFLKSKVMSMMEDNDIKNILKKDVVFVVSSTGGGTGSGSSIVLANIIKEVFVDTHVIVVGILPTLAEAFSTQVNTIEYMKELVEISKDMTYMMYDNEKFAKEPTQNMMDHINASIVQDINVLRGTYNVPTKYSSIDERDTMNIISTKGRIAMSSLYDIKEKDLDGKTIEEMLIEQLKVNAHSELQRDMIVNRTGIIVNLSERLIESFNSHLPKVQQFIGAPVEEFEHIAINEDRHMCNNVFLIAAGLTQVNDRIRRINERIDEINEQQQQQEDESELNAVDFDSMTNKIERRVKDEESSTKDISSIFSKFGV